MSTRVFEWRLIVAGAFLAAAISQMPAPARAGFEGNLELLPPGCRATGLCTLGQPFGFVDAAGQGWQAKKGLPTDGASIPPWAQPLVGQPFEAGFIKAAVIHDHYCERHVQPWRKTHRMFHEALLASNVPSGKAGVMYFAVLVGGPKWVELIRGRPCPVGNACVNQLDITESVPGSNIMLGEDGGLIAARPDEYGSARFAQTMAENLPALEAAGDGLTAAQVEAQAQAAMADDFYFINGDAVGTGLSVTLEFQ